MVVATGAGDTQSTTTSEVGMDAGETHGGQGLDVGTMKMAMTKLVRESTSKMN